MKNAIILHGSGETPNSFWYHWLKEKLENKGFEVWAPQLLESQTGELSELSTQLPFILKNGKIGKDTLLVGHSSGCPLILSVLQNIDVKVDKVILVAGFATPLNISAPEPILQRDYDWAKISQNASRFFFINSDNDPWGCDDKQGRHMFEKLGGTQIVLHGEGHMGSKTFNQPYKTFPLLEKLIEL